MLNEKEVAAQIERDGRKEPHAPALTLVSSHKEQVEHENLKSERMRQSTREKNYFQYWLVGEAVLRGLSPKEVGSAKVERAFRGDSRVIQITTPESVGPQRRITVEFESSGIVSCRAGWLNRPEGQQSDASYCTGFPLEQDTSYFPPQVAKRSNEIVEFVKRELHRPKLKL
jgi:hypothetical protein